MKAIANCLNRPRRHSRPNPTSVSRVASLILTTICVSLLTIASYAQQRTYTNPRNARTAHHASSSNRLPRSVPDSTTMGAAATNTAASRRELDRLEHASSARSATGTAQAARTSAGHSVAHRELGEHNAPINFSYHSPQKGQVGHGTAPPKAH